MTEQRRILITGARGDVGAALTSGRAGLYTLRLHNRTPQTEPAGIEHVTADIASYNEVRPIMADVDTVVHMAGDRRVSGDWQSILDANIIGIHNILKAK